MKILWIEVVWLVDQLKENDKWKDKNSDLKGETLAEFSEYNPAIIELVEQTKLIVDKKREI